MKATATTRGAGAPTLVAGLLAAALLWLSPAAGAQRVMTVIEAWARAETHHPGMMDMARRLEGARRELAQREAAYALTLNASVRDVGYGVDGDGKVTGPRPKPSLTASMKRAEGLTLSATLSSLTETRGEADSLTGKLTLNYPLFRSPALDSDALALRQARTSLALAEQEWRRQQDAARADVLAALHADDVAAGRLALAEEAFRDAQQAWAAMQRRVEQGIASEMELLGSQIDLLRAEQELLGAQRTRASRREQLLGLLGLPFDEDAYLFESVLDWTAMPEVPSRDIVAAQALALDPTLQEREEALQIALLQLEEERQRPPFESGLSASISTTLGDNRRPSWNIGVDFTYPVLDGGQRQRTLQSRQEAHERAQEAVDEAKQAVMRQVEDAYAQLLDAKREEEIARLELTRAQLELELVQRQADLPVAVVDAATLRQAERARTRADLAWRETVQRYQARWIALQQLAGPVDWTELVGGPVPDLRAAAGDGEASP